MRGVTIAILNYNRLSLLAKTLECIWETVTSEPDLPVEVLVVDNFSNEETRNWIENLSMTWKTNPRTNVSFRYIICDRNTGLSRGVNICFNQSMYEYIVRLDNDILINYPKWHQVMASYLDRFPEIGMIFPDYNADDFLKCRECGKTHEQTKIYRHHVNYNQEDWAHINLFPLCGECYERVQRSGGSQKEAWTQHYNILNMQQREEKKRLSGYVIDHGAYREIEWGPGMFFMVRKSLIEKIDGYDPELEHQNECDLALRVRMAGYCCALVEEFGAVHNAPPMSATIDGDKRTRRGTVQFVDKWAKKLFCEAAAYDKWPFFRWEDYPINRHFMRRYLAQAHIHPELNQDIEMNKDIIVVNGGEYQKVVFLRQKGYYNEPLQAEEGYRWTREWANSDSQTPFLDWQEQKRQEKLLTV